MSGRHRHGLTPARRRALNRLLSQYLEQPAQARAGFLVRCRQRWPRLGHWLERLVSSEGNSTLTLLNESLGNLAAGAASRIAESAGNRPAPGHRLGPWRLIEPVSEGGMGLVYQAERDDGAFEKTVAVKLLRLRGTGLGELIQRECQLLARLDHPGICRLLDAGLDEASGPFLVMEWIEGQDLSGWMKSCPSRQRCLEVMMSLCEAVDHAHRQLIVHGDIKPGNVQIDREGQVKLLDFGIARLAGATDEGSAAVAALTPTFAPPEQHRGEPLDARSDVWALGALMAWLLQGSQLNNQPDETDWLPVAKVAISNAELRAVVDKACAGDPDQRYGSARELLSDLQRFCQNYPLTAMPASAGYRVRKFLRRNPVLVGGIAATSSALVAGLIATAVWYVEASHKAEELASVVEFQARHLGTIDIQELGAVMRRDVLDQRRGALKVSGLTDDEIESGVEALEAILAGVNFTNTALATLDSGIFEHARKTIDQQFVDKPAVRASLLQTLASTMREVGLVSQAVAPQQVAVALRTETLGRRHPATLESIHEAAILAHVLADYDSAQSQLEQVIEDRRRVLGARHPDTLESAHALAETLRRQGRFMESESLAREVLSERRERLGREHPDTLATLAELGAAIRSQGRLDKAKPYYRQVAEIRESLLGPDHPDTLEAMNNLGLHLVRMDQLEKAESLYIETLERRRRVLGDNHPSTVISLNNMAALMRLKERYDRAEWYYQEALERAHRMFGDYHTETANLLNNLGVLYRHIDRLSASERFLRRALEARRQTRGPDHRATLVAKHNLARTLYEKGRLAEAEDLQARAVAGIEQILPEDHWLLGAVLYGKGRIFHRMDRFEEAESVFLETWDIFAHGLGPEHHRTTDLIAYMEDFYSDWARQAPEDGADEAQAKWLAQLESIAAEETD